MSGFQAWERDIKNDSPKPASEYRHSPTEVSLAKYSYEGIPLKIEPILLTEGNLANLGHYCDHGSRWLLIS